MENCVWMTVLGSFGLACGFGDLRGVGGLAFGFAVFERLGVGFMLLGGFFAEGFVGILDCGGSWFCWFHFIGGLDCEWFFFCDYSGRAWSPAAVSKLTPKLR